MSNENNNETKEVNMTATENENNVAETNNELNELRESNANLIAERKQLQDKIKSLEGKLKDEKNNVSRVYQWYTQEQGKVCALGLIIKAMKSDFVPIDQIVERITSAV